MGFADPPAHREAEEKEPPDGSEQWSFSLAFQSPAATGTRCFRGRCEILLMGNYGIIFLQGSFFPAHRGTVSSLCPKNELTGSEQHLSHLTRIRTSSVL